jgi:DNA topoisomerase-2
MFNAPVTKTFREFNLTSNVNTGSRLIGPKLLWIPQENKFSWGVETLHFSEALPKVIDEVITNAMDAAVPGYKVEIFYDFPKITVVNYGRFIKFETAQNAFSGQFTSSNYEKTKRTTGGLNGVGAKLTNTFSHRFYVEISDGKAVYKQLFRENMAIIEKPVMGVCIVKIPYVKVEFELDYDKLCCRDIGVPSENWISANMDAVEKIIGRRVFETALFLEGKCDTYYNGKLVKISFGDFVKAHKNGPADTHFTTIVGTEYPLKVGIILQDPDGTKAQGFKHITIINGVVIGGKNNIYTMLLKTVTDFVRNHPQFEKFMPKKVGNQFPKALFMDHAIIVVVGTIPGDEFEFGSQSKNTVNISKNAAARFEKNYVFDSKFLAAIWEGLKPIYGKIFVPVNKNKKVPIRQYEAASVVLRGGTGNHFFVGEGGSALLFMRKLIAAAKELSFERDGLYSIQGVPINPIKYSRIFETGPMMTEKLEKNIGIQGMVNVLGLRYGKSAGLRYKKIVFCTDQDSDGIGKICSLLICFFALYFPELIRNGQIYRYRTPIVRIKNKKLYKGFYSEQEYEMFTEKVKASSADTHYYKGLACHDENDIKKMAANFGADLVRVNWDDVGVEMMYRLYGAGTDGRKEELLRFNEKTIRKYENELNITMYEHFLNESIPEQAGNNFRMLPCAIDGLVPCQRKILMHVRGAAKYKLKTNVASLGGIIKENMKYDHGVASMEGAIMGMANILDGFNTFPILLPASAGFATKDGGAKEMAQARYSYICYNKYMNLYFPAEDDDLLDYRMEEGAYYEPVNFVPIIPRILTEFSKNVGTGWNSNFAARPILDVFRYVRLSVELFPNIICPNMHGRIQSKSKIIVESGREIGIGTYELSGNYLTITDLPPMLSGQKVIKFIKYSQEILDEVTEKKDKEPESKKKPAIRKRIVKTISNHHKGTDIRIILELEPDFETHVKDFHKKPYLDPIVEYFGIYKIYNRNLNFYGETSLMQFTAVFDVFSYWFARRKNLYERRYSKKLIYLELRWKYMECLHHFIKTDGGRIENKPESEQIKLLEETPVEFTEGTKIKGYLKLNVENIKMGFRGGAAELEKAVYSGADYSYIFDVKKRQTGVEYVKKYGLRVAAALAELEEYRLQTWKSIWLAELAELEKNYLDGLSKGWNYELY